MNKLINKIISISIIMALTLSFLIALPLAHATTPSIAFELQNTCTGVYSCGTSFNAFGTINNAAAFDPSTKTGDGLIAVFYCNPGGELPVFTMNSVVDTLNDTWQFAGSVVTGSNEFQGTITAFVFMTNIVPTVATSFLIYANTSPAAYFCNQELYLANTGLSISIAQSTSSLIFAGTGFQQTNVYTTQIQIQSFLTPPNTLQFEISWLNFGGTESLSFTQVNNVGAITLGLLHSQFVGTTPNLQTETSSGYTTAGVNSPYPVIWKITNTVSNYHYGIGLMVIIFNPFSVTQTASSSSCSLSGCTKTTGGSTIDTTTTFGLKANRTYYYYGTTGKGGLVIQNLTTKIASYTNGNAGKGTDTYMLSIYTLPIGTNISTSALANNPLKRIFNVNKTISTGATNQWAHGGNLNVVIPVNTSFAVAFITKFSGLRVYNSVLPTANMVNSTEGIFSGAVWSPPYLITQANSVAFNMYLFDSGYTNPINVVSTFTTTTNTSCVAGSSCQTATVTSWQIQTSFVTNLQGGGGGIAIIGNLISYWPIWMLPLFGIPFGLQGILIFFIMGIVLSSILGIIPLWAAFILGLGTVYLLEKRF